MPAHAAEHDGEVVVERATRKHAADGRLPGVPVRVDKTRHHDHYGCVDLFGFGRLDVASDLGDLAVLYEHIAVGHVADVGIHRDDEAVADQKPLRAHPSLLRWPD